MKIELKGHQIRKNRARAFWKQVVRDLNNGMTVDEIAKSYINPYTGKHYTKSGIYLALKKYGLEFTEASLEQG